jgi:hypothetical protein
MEHGGSANPPLGFTLICPCDDSILFPEIFLDQRCFFILLLLIIVTRFTLNQLKLVDHE